LADDLASQYLLAYTSTNPALMATGRPPMRSPASKSRPFRKGMPIVANQPGVVALAKAGAGFGTSALLRWRAGHLPNRLRREAVSRRRLPNARRAPPPPRRAAVRLAHHARRAARRSPGGSTPRRAAALARSRAATR
jgi:hypothetical protein